MLLLQHIHNGETLQFVLVLLFPWWLFWLVGGSWSDKEKCQFTVRYLTYFDVNYLDMKGLTLLGFHEYTQKMAEQMLDKIKQTFELKNIVHK